MSKEQDAFYAKLCGLLDDVHEVLVEFRRHVDTINATLLQGANRVTVDVTAGATSGQGQRPTTVSNALLGWSLREPTGANPATLILRDGADATGDEVASVTLTEGESTRDLFPFGVSLLDGLYLDCTVGEVVGAVYLRNT